MSTPAEIEAVTAILAPLLHPVIVELGAYCGEDSEWMREACGQTHSLNVLVEPDARNCEIIREYRRGVRTLLIEAAIADYTGQSVFNEGADDRQDGGRSGSGSIHTPTKHLELFPKIKFEPSLVPCWSLDHLMFSCGVRGIDLLWVDIQGAERDMIAGGQMMLARTRYLFIEAEQVELYEGQAMRAELLELLPGFKVIAELDYNLLLEAR